MRSVPSPSPGATAQGGSWPDLCCLTFATQISLGPSPWPEPGDCPPPVAGAHPMFSLAGCTYTGRVFHNNQTFPSLLDPCLSCICLVRPPRPDPCLRKLPRDCHQLLNPGGKVQRPPRERSLLGHGDSGLPPALPRVNLYPGPENCFFTLPG